MILDDLIDIAELQTKDEKAKAIDDIVRSGGGQILKMIFDDMVTFNVAVVRLPELYIHNTSLETPSNQDLESLLEKMAHSTLTGNNALNACANFANRLNLEQFMMFCDVLQSNPRIGIGATDLNKRSELFKVDQFKVHLCLALKKAKGKIPYGKVWVVQPKIDGNRIIGIKETKAKLMSRKGHERESLNHILDIINKRSDSFVLDGEVEYKDSLEATGAIRRKKEQAKEAVYTLFGEYQMDQWKSEKHTDTYQVCYDRAKAFVDSLTDYERCFVRIVESIVIGSFNSEAEWLSAVAEHYEHYLAQGYEGIIAKTVDHVYLPSSGSKRSIFTIKDKPWVDGECVVTGFNESDTNPDSFGSFQCIDAEGVEFSCAPGNIKKDELDYIWRHQYKFVDQTLEIKYQGKTIYNSYRHPNAVKFRDDI